MKMYKQLNLNYFHEIKKLINPEKFMKIYCVNVNKNTIDNFNEVGILCTSPWRRFLI